MSPMGSRKYEGCEKLESGGGCGVFVDVVLVEVVEDEDFGVNVIYRNCVVWEVFSNVASCKISVFLPFFWL